MELVDELSEHVSHDEDDDTDVDDEKDLAIASESSVSSVAMLLVMEAMLSVESELADSGCRVCDDGSLPADRDDLDDGCCEGEAGLLDGA